MEKIHQWFAKHQAKQQRFFSLGDMLFAEKHVQYPIYRLSLFNFQVLFLFLSHCVIFYLMFNQLSAKTFTFLIYIASLRTIFKSFWWGGLEVLRSHVRYFHRAKSSEDLCNVIDLSLRIASTLAFLFGCLSIFYMTQSFHLLSLHKEASSNLYLAITFLDLTLYTIVSVYHAGIYAITRIIRPHFSIVLSHVLGLCILILLWPSLHFQAVLLSILVQSTSASALTYYYTSYMYKLYGLSPDKPRLKKAKALIQKFSIYHFFLAGTANLASVLDYLLIIGFYYMAQTNSGYETAVTILYLISPLISATSSWARLFYFDRKKLENSLLYYFVRRYNKVVGRVASAMGFCLGIYAVVACIILIHADITLLTITAIPLFVLRSRIANLQVHAFCSHYYLDVIVSWMLLALSVVALSLSPLPTIYVKGFFLLIAMILIYKFLQTPRFPISNFINSEMPFATFYEWLSNLVKQDCPVELCHLELDPSLFYKQKIFLIRKLRESFELKRDQICMPTADTVQFFQITTSSTVFFSNKHLTEIGMGTICSVQNEVIYPKLQSSSKNICSSVSHGKILSEILTYSTSILKKNGGIKSEHDLCNAFLNFFPEGIYHSPERHLGPKAQPLPKNEIQKISSLVWQVLYNKQRKLSDQTDLSVLVKNGKVIVVFLVPVGSGSEKTYSNLKKWTQIIRAFNIVNALPNGSKKENLAFNPIL